MKNKKISTSFILFVVIVAAVVFILISYTRCSSNKEIKVYSPSGKLIKEFKDVKGGIVEKENSLYWIDEKGKERYLYYGKNLVIIDDKESKKK